MLVDYLWTGESAKGMLRPALPKSLFDVIVMLCSTGVAAAIPVLST